MLKTLYWSFHAVFKLCASLDDAALKPHCSPGICCPGWRPKDDSLSSTINYTSHITDWLATSPVWLSAPRDTAQVSGESQEDGTFYKNSFIDLLTTVHVFSVLTACATYFGVILWDSHTFPLMRPVRNADTVRRSTVYKPGLFTAVFVSTWETLDLLSCAFLLCLSVLSAGLSANRHWTTSGWMSRCLSVNQPHISQEHW